MKKIVLLTIACIISIWAKNIQIEYNKVVLNGDYKKVSKDKTIYLITHGTLAYNKMEIVQALQELLEDNKKNSLAINLSLGISNRKSMIYDCTVTHKHTHKDAINEINAWVKYLKQQGYTNIHLIGHSRGGNQTAWFYHDTLHKEVKTASLIAPSTWNKSKIKLQKELKRAKKNISMGKSQKIIKNIDFIYCKNSNATSKAVEGYYKSRAFFDTPTILKNIKKPVIVFIGSEDKIVKELPQKMKKIKNKNVKSITIDGADHFFRDLYLEETMDSIMEFSKGKG